MFVALNVIAFMQARSMTHYERVGTRTQAPEHLTLPSKLHVLLTGVTVPRPTNEQTPKDFDLNFDTLRIGELELWHIPASTRDRPLVICFHSYASSKQMLLPLARELHDMNCPTLLVDFRGSGGSSGDETTVGYREADDVIAAVKFARERFAPSRVILYGDSMGAAAVIRAMSLDPKLADAIIVDAPFDRLLSTVENRFVAMNLPTFPFAQLICFWGGVRQGYWAFDHNPADYAINITCPVLHLHGEHDPRVTLAEARNLFDHFAGPKQFVLFSGAGHSSHLDSDRARWTETVRAFIESTIDLR
jgi:pimeloyl-ACP methyl ester carboxylesterase